MKNLKNVEEIMKSNCAFRSRVASNPNTTVEILNELAKDDDCGVRSRVASNPNTTVEILNELAKDDDYVVSYSVAFNPNTTGGLTIEDWKEDGFISTFSKNDQEKIHDCMSIFEIFTDGMYNERMEILNQLDLDEEFNETFNMLINKLKNK